MKKTISINISGIFFHIDENAYHTLESYLETIRLHYENSEGKDEILGDIESRIAEIFQTKVSQHRQVIQQEDVDEVISILGKPEDIFGEDGAPKTNGNGAQARSRRLYRDTDNRILGGVCSGIGRYFDADPVWFRIAFLVALFIFGSSVLVYLVLWIIIPPANTTAEKLEMRGEKMNLKNIEQNIREEFEELKKKYHDKKWRKPRTREEIRNFKRRMHELKREMRSSRSRVAAEADTTGRRIAGVFENLLYYFVKVVLMFVGLLLLALGIAITVGLIISLTGSENYFMISQWGIRTVSLPAFTSLIFDTELQGTLALTGLGLLLGVPLAMMIIGGFRLVLGYKNRIRLLSLTATCLWLAGLFLTLFSGFMMYRSFRDKAAVKEEIAITAPENKILYLDVPKTYYLPDADDDTKNTMVFNNIYFVADEFATRNYGYHKLRIVPGDTGEYMLTVHKSAMGKNIPLARNRAANIAFHAHQADSVIWIDNHFTLPEGEKWRNQKVTLTLKVPEGQVIHLRRNMEMLLHRSDQADDTWSDEMIGKNMIMTAGGLK